MKIPLIIALSILAWNAYWVLGVLFLKIITAIANNYKNVWNNKIRSFTFNHVFLVMFWPIIFVIWAVVVIFTLPYYIWNKIIP